MNSFRSVERAIESEIARQIAKLEAGERIVQETRGWDEHRGVTHSMRSKEEAHDYRYFPEPDLVPLDISREEVEVFCRRASHAAVGALRAVRVPVRSRAQTGDPVDRQSAARPVFRRGGDAQ